MSNSIYCQPIILFFFLAGSVVGIAFGTFILGLIVGAVVLFLVTKFRSKTHEEYEMHITKHEH